MEIDLAEIAPAKTSIGRGIALLIDSKNVTVFTPRSEKWGGGKESKRIVINRFVLLDDLFFEGLGLWVGEGGKSKGLYFGNSNTELLSRFLEFSERRLRINRNAFKATINTPEVRFGIKEKWSKSLQIPLENFTNVCVDQRINLEYVQVYLNSVVLVEFMKSLERELSPLILSTLEFTVPFLRGMFSAEGQVALKKWGTVAHVSISSTEKELVLFLKRCLQTVGITSGKYMLQSRAFPICGYRNLKRFKELGIHTLHPDKREKFERGFAAYKRINVLDGDEARNMILQQLASSPKTYDDLAAALGKARTTIQAHHIPILEHEGKIRRAGKRRQAWLWELAEPKPVIYPTTVDQTFVTA